MTDPPAPSSDPLEVAVLALIDLGATLSQVVAHMTAYQERSTRGGGVDGAPIGEVLAPMLVGCLADLAERHGSEAMDATAGFLQAAAEVLAEQLVLVAPDPPRPNREQRRRRR